MNNKYILMTWLVLDQRRDPERPKGDSTGNPNAVLANRIIKCIYVVLFADKIIRSIYLCSCVFMSRFRRDLNPIRDG